MNHPMSKQILTAVSGAMLAFSAANAETTAPNENVQAFLDSLHFQTGVITVAKADATLKLTPEFRYLDATDAQRVLTELWGNPPHADVLGMLVPTADSLNDESSWAVVITYSNDGYVSDEDAAKIDYDNLLKEMQTDTLEANTEREKAGYGRIELVGWATKPHYDKNANKLYWAKELKFRESAQHTLNYDIRALGRGGYLSLNAIASMNQLATVEAGMQKVLALTEFDAGHRYADFNSSTDKIAAYGIGALVAGAIAVKAGLFTKLIALLFAAKKILIGGAIAVGVLLKKLFGGKKEGLN